MVHPPQYAYVNSSDYLYELESYSFRIDRIISDFSHLPPSDQQRILLWVTVAFDAARAQKADIVL